MANREIDDVYNRIASKDSYKNRVFDGKKSITDEYTGKRIFYGNSKDAQKLHPLDKVADIDHITPIAKIRERYKDLSIDQQKRLANNERYNYATTNATLNRLEKNAFENHEYLAKKTEKVMENTLSGNFDKAGKQLSDLSNEAPRMLSKEIKSRTYMEIEAGGFRTANTVNKVGNMVGMDIDISPLTDATSELSMDFLDGASDSIVNASFPLMILGIQNICEVASGQKTMEDARNEMGHATLEVAVRGGGGKVAEKMVKELTEKTGSELLKLVSQNVNGVVQVANVGLIVFKSFNKLINDEISGVEFFDEIGEQGVGLIGDFLGSTAGYGIAKMLTAGMAAGPAGLLVGAGAFVGGMIVMTVCTAIYRNTIRLREKYKAMGEAYRDRIASVNRIADMAIIEMEFRQEQLGNMIKEEYTEWAEKFDLGFQTIMDAMWNNDFEHLSVGLNEILNVFGNAVKFESMEEFDEFFFDNDAILTL